MTPLSRSARIAALLPLSIVCYSSSTAADGWKDLFGSGSRTCVIEHPVEAAQLAAEKGFSFDSTPVNASGRCEIFHGSMVNIVDAGGNHPVVCNVTYFGGRKLTHGWRVGNGLSFSSTVKFIEKPQEGSDVLTTIVTVEKQPGEPASLYLKKLVLVGPDCDKWQDAFD